MFGYIKVKTVTKEVRKEIKRRIENDIEEPKWNEGVMFVLDIFESKL